MNKLTFSVCTVFLAALLFMGNGNSLPWKSYAIISANSTNATLVKSTPGVFGGWSGLSNINAAPRYLKLYDKASLPVVGTDVPKLRILIPGNTGGILANHEITRGIQFNTGIAFALTTGAADTDTGAVAADELLVNLNYE